jgi:hypothetical protein
MKMNTTTAPESTPEIATVAAAPAAAKAPKATKPAPKKAAKKSPVAVEVKANPTVKITGKEGSLSINGQGTIAELAPLLTEKSGKTWENPTATALVNGLVLMGGAVAIGTRPHPEAKRGRTAKVYNFSAKIG